MLCHLPYGDFPVMTLRRYDATVHSENAWTDDGRRLALTLWSEEYGALFTLDNYTDEFLTPAVVPDSLLARARAFSDAAVWLNDLRRHVWETRYDPRVRVGDQVEVFKGRKAPRGTYTVRDTGKNQYGSYYHLRDADGQPHSYIAAGNCRRVHRPLESLALSALPVACWPLIDTVASAQFGQTPQDVYHAGLALADALEDLSDPRASHVRAFMQYHMNPGPVNGERGSSDVWSTRGYFCPLPSVLQEGVTP